MPRQTSIPHDLPCFLFPPSPTLVDHGRYDDDDAALFGAAGAAMMCVLVGVTATCRTTCARLSALQSSALVRRTRGLLDQLQDR